MSHKLHNPKSFAPSVYIPCWLIQVPIKQLSHGAKMTYGRLSQWADDIGHAYRSAKQLSHELGTSEASIERYLHELRINNLIGTYHPQAGGVNHFEFYDHPWMHEPINEHLVYKQNKYDPPSNLREPSLESEGTPPSNLRDINNKEIKENKMCVGKYLKSVEKKTDASHTHNVKNLEKEKAEEKALNDPKIIEAFQNKFSGYQVTIEELFMNCREHYEQKNLWASSSRFTKWIASERVDNFSKTHNTSTSNNETEDDREERYRQERIANGLSPR